MENDVRTTVSLQDLAHLEVWSPQSLASVEKVDLEPGDAFVFALVFDGDAYEDWDATSEEIFVVKAPINGGLVGGVGLKFDNGAWVPWGALLDSSRTLTWYVLGNVPVWLRVLYSLVQKVFAPLWQIRSSDELVTSKINREVNTRCSYFRFGGPAAFFDDRLDMIAWSQACRWDEWERHQPSTDERIQTIHDELGVRISMEVLNALVPAEWEFITAQAKNVLRKSVEAPKADWSFLNSADPCNRREFWANQSEIWTLGGSPKISIPRSSRIVTRFPSAKADVDVASVASSLWWWRTSEFEVWDKNLKAIFFDNWEPSALYYEFRARERRDERGAPFGKLWCHLNNSQRGVLTALWPVQGVGPAKLRKEVAGPIARFMVTEAVKRLDPNASTDDLPRVIEEALGIRPRSSANGKRNKAPKKVLSERWRALEYMDKAHFAKERLLREEQTIISKLRTEYQKACAVAGIEP